jgi:hypothetical protein
VFAVSSLFLMFTVQFSYKNHGGVCTDLTIRVLNLKVYSLDLMLMKLLDAWYVDADKKQKY